VGINKELYSILSVILSRNQFAIPVSKMQIISAKMRPEKIIKGNSSRSPSWRISLKLNTLKRVLPNLIYDEICLTKLNLEILAFWLYIIKSKFRVEILFKGFPKFTDNTFIRKSTLKNTMILVLAQKNGSQVF
jgi:hypothetical protein